MSREAWMSTAIPFAVSLVLFGLGAAVLLALPGLGPEAQLLLPVIVLAGILLAPYLGWFLTLRSRTEPPQETSDQLRPNVSSSRMMSSSPR